MTAKKRTSVPEDKLRLYERLIEEVAGVEAKSNFGSGYTAVNGNMYSMISKHGVVGIRLPEPDRSEFISRHNTEIFRADPAWPPAKEYVAVPDSLLAHTDALVPYLQRSYEYALTLKPKPTKKSKPKPANR
jgi:TfoX/Sxy family transcriptional regulator of competence genes